MGVFRPFSGFEPRSSLPASSLDFVAQLTTAIRNFRSHSMVRSDTGLLVGPILPARRARMNRSQSLRDSVLDGDVVRTDTLAQARMPSLEQRRFRMPSGSYRERRLTPPLLVGTLARGGVAFSDISAYRIRITDPEGAIEHVLMRPFAPKPMTDRMREVARQHDIEVFERELPTLRNAIDISDRFVARMRAREESFDSSTTTSCR